MKRPVPNKILLHNLGQLAGLVTFGHFFQGNDLDFDAWPSQPKAWKSARTTASAAARAGFRKSRGSNFDGFSNRNLRVAAVIARRMSVSMLILRTPWRMPSWISSTGTP